MSLEDYESDLTELTDEEEAPQPPRVQPTSRKLATPIRKMKDYQVRHLPPVLPHSPLNLPSAKQHSLRTTPNDIISEEFIRYGKLSLSSAHLVNSVISAERVSSGHIDLDPPYQRGELMYQLAGLSYSAETRLTQM